MSEIPLWSSEEHLSRLLGDLENKSPDLLDANQEHRMDMQNDATEQATE
jgi:hypothetical protein